MMYMTDEGMQEEVLDERNLLQIRINKRLTNTQQDENGKLWSLNCCDFVISLFHAALHNYRRSTVCQPVPKVFQNVNKEPNFDEMETHFARIPSVRELTKRGVLESLPTPTLQLIDFILHPNFDLREVPFDHYKTQQSYKVNPHPLCVPKFVFEIVFPSTDDRHKRFVDLSKKHGNVYAYHGSALENWYSITNNGLDSKFSKETSLFGMGTYLTFDNSVAENFFAFGNVWKHSSLGHKLGCIAGCSVVKNLDYVKSVGVENKDKYSAKNGNEMKNNYLVVTHDGLIAVKHILVFTAAEVKTTRTNKCVYMLLFYVLLLAFVAFMRSSWKKKFLW